MAKRELWELKSMQAAPLPVKILLTKARIREWINEFGEDGVYVSFSGGKDSTVLLDIVRQDYPNVPAVFCDTGLEYPEIREFVKTFDNVTWLKPELTFKQTIEKCGYPFVTKEVAECVYGARRYIESVIGDDQKIEDIGADLIAILDKESLKELSGGGKKIKEFPQRYRQLRAIGEFDKGGARRGKSADRQFSCATATGDTSEDRESDCGEYP